MENENNFDEEDEDVVIQGSALHEHLTKLGYTDFESVSIPKKTHLEEKKKFHINVGSTLKQIYVKLISFYSWITQENKISEKQLSVILKNEVLLSDHSSAINNFLVKYNSNSKKITLQELVVTGSILASLECISVCKYKMLPILFASSAICCTSYIKYLRFYTNRELRNVISLQNELFAMCKESLKILQRDYNIKFGFDTSREFLSHLGEKLQYLQSLTDTLVQFMENVSSIYYETSLSIANLLPASVLTEESFTKFEHDAFEVHDEINYQTLKKLYHTYLLVQSEMLYLLAIAYDSDTWAQSCRKMPETKLAYIIHRLAKKLTMNKVQLSESINTYHACKVEPIRHKAQNRAKWHDPTVQLDLASYKLQFSYSQVFSIFKDIDDCINRETSIDKETAKALMERLDKAFKEVDTAKTLAEFVVLLMARSEFNNLRGNTPATDDAKINQNSDLPAIIINSDPEILDEVFEEYIKEEYEKPTLREDADEYSSEQYKLNKLLAKSFMNELREALVDKQKSMSERESNALQRMYKQMKKDFVEDKANDEICRRVPTPPPMPSYYIRSTPTNKEQCIYKNITKDPTASTEHNAKEECRDIPAPPPIPSYNVCSTSTNDEFNSSYKAKTCTCGNKISSDSFDLVKMNEPEEVDPPTTPGDRNVFDRSNKIYRNNDEEPVVSLSYILLGTPATRFAAKSPPAFLQEEVFIGNGENLEDEMMSDANDEVNKDSQ